MRDARMTINKQIFACLLLLSTSQQQQLDDDDLFFFLRSLFAFLFVPFMFHN
jgi:hypothetical protein